MRGTKVLAMFIMLVMALAGLSVIAGAEDTNADPEASLWVNGIDAISDSANLPAGCSYSAENNTLTISSGDDLTVLKEEGGEKAVILDNRETTLIIHIERGRTISSDADDACGIYVKGNLTITGELNNTLLVDMTGNDSYGLKVEGYLSVLSGMTNLSGSLFGIWTMQDMTLSGGTTQASNVDVNQRLIVSDSSRLYSGYVNAVYGIEVCGGTLSAINSSGGNDIDAPFGNFVLSSGSVELSGSGGLDVVNFTMTGGILTLDGSNPCIGAAGSVDTDGIMTITGGQIVFRNLTILSQDAVLAYASSNGEGITERLTIAPAAFLDNVKIGELDPNTLTLIDPSQDATIVFKSLWVGGIDAINDSENLPQNCSYDFDSNTLTLNDASIMWEGKFNGERPGGTEVGAAIYDNRGVGLNLAVIGDNSITVLSYGLSGIYVSSDLSISGTGSLSIDAGGDNTQGIMLTGDLTISDATISASARQFDVFILSGSMTMSSGYLEITGSGCMDSNGDVIVEGGEINFNCPSEAYRLGIMAGDFVVSGGQITFNDTSENELLIESSNGFQFTNGVTPTGMAFKTYGEQAVDWDSAEARLAYASSTSGAMIGSSVGPSPVLGTAPVAASVTYDGSSHALIAKAGTATNGSMMYAVASSDTLGLVQIKALSFVSVDSSVLKETDAGTYYVYYMVKGDEGYSDLYDTSYCVTAKIAKADINPLIKNLRKTVAYGRTISPMVSGNIGNGIVTYSYEGILGTTYGPSEVPPTEVGNYRLTAEIEETDNYKGGTVSRDFEIVLLQETLWVNGIDAINDPTNLPDNCYFDADNNVLILSGATLTECHSEDLFQGGDGAVILDERPDMLTILIEDNNFINNTSADISGIYTKGSLIIGGLGHLGIISSRIAIITEGSLVISDEAKIRASGCKDVVVNEYRDFGMSLSMDGGTLNLDGSGYMSVMGPIYFNSGLLESAVSDPSIWVSGFNPGEGKVLITEGTLRFSDVSTGHVIIDADSLEIGYAETDNLEFGDGKLLAKADGEASMMAFAPLRVNGVDIIANPESIPDNCTYDRDTNTLTLDGATLDVAYEKAVIESLSYSCLNLVINGENTITNTSNDPSKNNYGITSNGSIFITGTGSLTVFVTGTDSLGIYAETDLIIEDASVIVTGSDDSDVVVRSGDFVMASGSLKLSGTGRMQVNDGCVYVYGGQIDFDVSGGDSLHIGQSQYTGTFDMEGGKINFNDVSVGDLLLTAENGHDLYGAPLDGVEFRIDQQSGFHQAFATKDGTVSIGSEKKDMTGITVSVSDWAYGDKIVPIPTISGSNPTENEPVYYYYKDGNKAKEWSTIKSGTYLQPGEYNIYATIAGDWYYNEYKTPVQKFTVSKYGVRLTGIIYANYDGGKTFTEIYEASTGDMVEYTVTASSSLPGDYEYEDGNDGTYTVNLDSDKYELESCTATLWISSNVYFEPTVSGGVAKAPTEEISKMFEIAKKDGARIAYIVATDEYESVVIDPAIFRMIGSTYDPEDDDEINGSAFGVSVKNGMTLFFAKALAMTVLPEGDMTLSVSLTDTKPSGFEDYDIAKVIVSSLVAGDCVVTTQADNCVEVGAYYDLGTHTFEELKIYALGSDGALTEISNVDYHKSSSPEYSQLWFYAGTTGQFGVAFEELRLTHKVAYDANGGSAGAPTQDDVMQGTTFIVAPYDGTKEGYAFVGWNDGTSDYKAGDEYVMGTSDVRFTAVWKVAQAELSLSLTMADYDYGATASVPVLTGNAGNGAVTYEYKQKGADDATYVSDVPVSVGDYTVKATVAATAAYAGATVTADFAVRAVDLTVTVTQPTGAGTSSIEYDGKADGSFKLKNTLPIKVDINENVITFYTGATVADGVLKTLTATADGDHKFAKWIWTDASGSAIAQPTELTVGMIIGAEFVEKAKYVVKIGSVTGGTVAAEPASAVKDAQVTLTVTPAVGYELKDLIVQGNDVTSSVSQGVYTFAMGESDVYVTATFEERTFAIAYDPESLNGAANPNTVSSYKVTDDSIILKSPVKAGYTFIAWYTDPAFVNAISVIDTHSAQDYTLYALWAKEAAAIAGEDGITVSSTDSNTVIITTDLGSVEKETTVNLNTGTGQGQSDSSIVFPAGTVFGEKPVVSIINTTQSAKDDQGHDIAGEGELVVEIKLTGVSLSSGATVKVTVPYELPEGVDPSNIKVYFLDDTTGTKKLMSGIQWKDGQVSFDTTHNSMYQISTANYVSAINLSNTYVSMNVDSTIALTYTTVPSEPVSSAVVWSSSDMSVATVDQNGTITAKKAGTAVITCASADVEDVKATCTVNVSSGSSGGGSSVVTYTVKITAGEGGKVTRSSMVVPSGTVVKASGNVLTVGGVMITAKSDEGYEFDSWSMTSGTIRSKTTITASFQPVVVPDKPTEVIVENGSVTISKDTADALGITDPSKLDLKIVESKPTQSNIPASAKAYDISLSYDGRALTKFSPAIEITVKYVPGFGEDTSKLKVYYVSADGRTVEDMKAVYDADKGGMVFSTTHLSTYVISSERIEPVPEPVVLSSIAVKTAPSKTTYESGERFDPSGLAITLNYSDGTTKDVGYKGNESLFSFSPSGELKTSDKSVTISYEGKTASQPITVSEKSSGDNTVLYIGIAVAVILIIIVAVFLIRRKI